MPHESGYERESSAGTAVPVLSFHGGVTLAVTTSTGRIALPTGFVWHTLLALDAEMHLKFGDVTVTAGDGLWDLCLPAGASIQVPVRPGITHVAAIGDAAGRLKIMGRK